MGEVCNREDESKGNTSSRRRLRGVSDDMVGKNRNGTWETLTDPDEPKTPLGKNRSRALSIKTKKRGKSEEGGGWDRSTEEVMET